MLGQEILPNGDLRIFIMKRCKGKYKSWIKECESLNMNGYKIFYEMVTELLSDLHDVTGQLALFSGEAISDIPFEFLEEDQMDEDSYDEDGKPYVPNVWVNTNYAYQIPYEELLNKGEFIFTKTELDLD